MDLNRLLACLPDHEKETMSYHIKSLLASRENPIEVLYEKERENRETIESLQIQIQEINMSRANQKNKNANNIGMHDYSFDLAL